MNREVSKLAELILSAIVAFVISFFAMYGVISLIKDIRR